MKKFHLLLVMICSLGVLKAQDYPTVQENGKTYIIYTVQKSEGVYAASRRFGVPVSEIIAVNPGSENGLKLGQTLRIPVKSEIHEATTQAKPATDTPTQPVATHAENAVSKAFGQRPTGSDPGYTTHVVKAKETLYSLAKKYGTTVDGLLVLNPWATQLQTGSVLVVPDPDYAKAQAKARKQAEKEAEKLAREQEKRKKEAEREQAEREKAEQLAHQAFGIPDSTQTAEAADTLATDSLHHKVRFYDPDAAFAEQKPQNHINIAVLMPFALDATERDQSMDRFVEFYKGCLLAADSLTNHGISFDFYVYDMGKSDNQVKQTLNNEQLKHVDLIIGPAYQNQIVLVSQFAAEYHIPMVVPFASNTAETLKNKYVFQIVSPQKELYEVMADGYVESLADYETVIIEPKKITQADKFAFADTLVAYLQEANLPFHKISDAQIAIEADSIARLTEKKVLLVLPSTQPGSLTNLGEQLKLLTEPNIEVFGFSEWHNAQLKDVYERSMLAFTNYYTDFNAPQVHRFFAKFINKYGMPGLQNIPNYALFGYDITLFFSEMIANYGPDFRFFLPEVPVELMQMDFYFEKMSQEGGYLNRGVILQKFDSEGINRYYR